MSNLFQRLEGFLTRQLSRGAAPAGQVVYTREAGGEPIDITGVCVVGRTVYARVPTDNGPTVLHGERDYLVPASALPGPPTEHDRIEEEGIGTFEVLPEFGEACWVWSGPDQQVYRIHTKRVD